MNTKNEKIKTGNSDNVQLRIVMHIKPEAEFHKDIVIYQLGQIGFDAFEETSNGIIAYCQQDIFVESLFITFLPKGTRYKIEKISNIDWVNFYKK
ncbi:MAG: hypothetical protein CSA89_01590 [Bacteroidales bacterium]|nr:MAG: hypothetical protein CSA89_01590 [Bacteroidales bacterium]